MKNYIVITFLIILAISCSKEKQEKIYYKNGNLKSLKLIYEDSKKEVLEEYDILGNLILKGFYTSGTRDSLFGYNKNNTLSFKKRFKNNGAYSKEYDTNGNLEREGIYIYDTIKADWWKFYKKGILEAKREYVIVCDDYYLNQVIVFNRKKDTVIKKDSIMNVSTFFKIRKEKKKDSFQLSYNVRSIFVKNKLEFIILKGTNCEEEPDFIIELNSNKGKIVLDKKYYNRKGFFFDYNIDQNNGNKVNNHKKYFDLSKLNN
ncbi:hypothetical protein [Flavobacterium sp. GSA192]|uniref:hypothetical protein n=1 Tax=Flavobacterium sp. GSA192 TaxID=2576304 RepID=UPI00112684D3|nr:hypothetical protein [Flavobacterium sp. GSA192]